MNISDYSSQHFWLFQYWEQKRDCRGCPAERRCKERPHEAYTPGLHRMAIRLPNTGPDVIPNLAASLADLLAGQGITLPGAHPHTGATHPSTPHGKVRDLARRNWRPKRISLGSSKLDDLLISYCLSTSCFLLSPVGIFQIQ